jgi:hypothetical protein
MIRLDVPDGTDERALETFRAGLNKSARAVRAT